MSTRKRNQYLKKMSEILKETKGMKPTNEEMIQLMSEVLKSLSERKIYT